MLNSINDLFVVYLVTFTHLILLAYITYVVTFRTIRDTQNEMKQNLHFLMRISVPFYQLIGDMFSHLSKNWFYETKMQVEHTFL